MKITSWAKGKHRFKNNNRELRKHKKDTVDKDCYISYKLFNFQQPQLADRNVHICLDRINGLNSKTIQMKTHIHPSTA